MSTDHQLDVFLAVGHGVEPDGTPDPGAIGTDRRKEHDEAFQVCKFALAAMRRSGLTVVSETTMGASHDPDYRGSANRANQLKPRVAIEVHFDSRNGVHGYAGQYFSAQGLALSKHIGDAFIRRGLPRKADVQRPELFFLNSTTMPALIPEINVTHKYGARVNQAQGEALAEGTCVFLGHAFRPPGKSPNPHVHAAPSGAVTADRPS